MKKVKKAAKAKKETKLGKGLLKGLTEAVTKEETKQEQLIVVEDLNDMAVFISQVEGKKEQVNIAQIKEILSVLVGCFKIYPFKTMEILCKAAMKN